MEKCTNCEEASPINRCVKCGEDLCSECSTAHKRSKKTKEHQLTNLEGALRQGNVELAEQLEGVQNILKVTKEEEDQLSLKRGEVLENDRDIKEKLDQHFEAAICKIRDKKHSMVNAVKEITKQRENVIKESQKKLRHIRTETDKQLTDIREGRAGLTKEDVNAFIKAKQMELEELVPEFDNIVLSGVCPMDDVNKMVDALGQVQHGTQGVSQPVDNTTAKFHVLTVFKKPSVDDESGAPNVSRSELSGAQATLTSLGETPVAVSRVDFQHSVLTDTFVLNNVHPLTSVQGLVPMLTDESPERSRLYGSEQVQTVFVRRLATQGLGHCKMEVHDIDSEHWNRSRCGTVVYARTIEEASQCLQLLKQLVFERSLKVNEESMFLVDSDKWQMLTRAFKQSYSNQVAFEVNHTENEVVCLSTSMAALLDVVDGVRNYFRDHTTSTIAMSYCSQLIDRIMSRKTELKNLLASYSQYLVRLDVKKQADTEKHACISVSGIGCGLAEVVRRIHEIAVKCSKASDSDDEDEEDRFSDEDDVEKKADDCLGLSRYQGELPVDLRMSLSDKETVLRCLCTPGGPRVLYVVKGNILKLPAEGLVNPADSKLKHDGGLARAIVRAGGRSIQEECTFHVSQNGKLSPGQVYVSGAGNLPHKNLLHAAGTQWTGGDNNEREMLAATIRKILDLAAERGLVSLAMPAIGTGSFKYPVKLATETILNTLKSVFDEKPTSCVREVYLCDVDDGAVNAFVDETRRAFKDDDIVLAGVEHRDIVLLL